MKFAKYLKSLPENTIFRLWRLKHIFTPFEQDVKDEYQSIYEDEVCKKVHILDALDLPDGDMLLAVHDIEHSDGYIEYFKLSNVELARTNKDNDKED